MCFDRCMYYGILIKKLKLTKEFEQKYKELRKALPEILKDKIKKYKFKKKDYMIWFSKKIYFSMR